MSSIFLYLNPEAIKLNQKNLITKQNFKVGYLRTFALVVLFLANFSSYNFNALYANKLPGITISGKITDEEGLPMPSATIIIKGTTTGVISQIDGAYSINVPSESTVLIFSYTGYVKQEIAVTNRKIINVEMQPNATSLNEMVVVGYGVEKKALLTSAVGVVNAEALKNIPLPTLDGVLQGQTAGVQISQNSGTPGGGMSVRIRGLSSITGSNQPLYVIDGIPITTGDFAQVGYEGQGTNALSDINPSDIESVSILKDAAAASIYGARATNGVVLITTKRGKNQKSIISANVMYGVQEVWKKLKMLDAHEWMEYRNDLSGTQVFSQSQMDNISVDTNWQNEIFRIAPTASVELSAAGGNEKTRFFMSGDYFGQQGVIKGADYSRLNGRLNIDHSLTDKITVGASLGISYAKTNRIEGDASLHGVLPNGISTPAIFPVYNADGTYNQDGPYSNAISIVNEAINQNFSFRTLGNAFLDYKIMRNLTLSTKWSVDYLSFREHAFEYNTVQGQKYVGLGFSSFTNVINTVSNNTLKYNFAVDKHSVEMLGGYSFEFKEKRYTYMRAQNYPDENLQYSVSASNIVEANTNALDEGTESFFGRLNYNFNNKYIASLSGRGDASSKFGPDNQWGFFPAASVAWRVSEEKSFNLPSQINELKARVSYGYTGNDDIEPFLFKELIETTETYNSQPAYYPWRIPNPALKWESTAQFNAGLDVSLFNSRVNLTVDYYNKQTKDLLLDRPLPTSSGYSYITENIGRVENKGWELSVSTVNLDGKLKWNTTFNISTNKNKVLELYNNNPIDDLGRGSNRVMIGQPIGVFYNYKWLGVDPSTGDCVYADPNNNGLDTSDRTIVGNPHPDFIGGLTNTFSYKGFDLSIFLQFSYGNDVFNGSRLYLESLTGGDNQVEDVIHRWKNPGDITWIPRATSDATATANNRMSSSRFIEDGSFLRIKNLNFGYSLNKKIAKKLKLENIRLYCTAQNLFTFTTYSGMDPEVNYAGDDNTIIGTDFFTYPQSRSYNFGINLKF